MCGPGNCAEACYESYENDKERKDKEKGVDWNDWPGPPC